MYEYFRDGDLIRGYFDSDDMYVEHSNGKRVDRSKIKPQVFTIIGTPRSITTEGLEK